MLTGVHDAPDAAQGAEGPEARLELSLVQETLICLYVRNTCSESGMDKQHLGSKEEDVKIGEEG